MDNVMLAYIMPIPAQSLGARAPQYHHQFIDGLGIKDYPKNF
jgi:hypothetical protein